MHPADGRVVEALLARQAVRHVMLRPPRRELGTEARQSRNQSLEIWITDMLRAVGTERRERAAGHVLPIDEQTAVSRVGEQQVEDVGPAAIKPSVGADNNLGRLVPREDVPAP